jgi:DNA-binding transcriptional LysR family regulator
MHWDDRIGRRLRLRDLHTLVAVARKGSMAKAAADLAVTQPAISRAIAAMEHTLGVPLLDRKPQGVEPTLYGQALLRWGETVFEDLRHAVKEIESLADPTAGEVSVGGTGPMVEGFLPAVIDRLSRQYPRIVLKVAQRLTTVQQHDELRARTLDLVVGRVPRVFAENDLHREILFAEPLFVVAGAKSQWVRRRRMALAELIDELWVLPAPETAVGSFVADVFRASGLEFPKHGVICNSLSFSSTLIATGRYLGMFPGSFWHFSATRSPLKVLPVKLPLEAPPVGLVTLKNRTLSPAAKLFIDCARTVARPLS